MLDLLSSIGSAIMAPLYFVISLILSSFHRMFGSVFGEESGISWVLSIIGLTLVIRAALIPLFVKQIKSSRNMQLLQPRVKELREKYGHDREKFAQEQMALYKETGTNPLASCLPLLIQMPIFLALFRVIDRASHHQTRGVLTQTQVDLLADAKIFGARIADTFTGAAGESATQVRILAALLVVAMTATTFLTQRQLMSKNMPADALTGQYAQQQKMLLYILPLVFAIGGIAFPIGVLVYWTTSNLWTMSQQFYVIRRNPAPGTPAAEAKAKRDAGKGTGGSTAVLEKPSTKGASAGTTSTSSSTKGGKASGKGSTRVSRKSGSTSAAVATPATATPEVPMLVKPPPPRQQPKRQTREQRKKRPPATRS